MTLSAGMRLGPYEIVAPLGSGGMGEVYRARDTKLDRDVAIKVLPPLFANDPERLARFEREAKTLAALNHPHIAHVHGFETGASGSALVMELVEGEDLSDRIRRGPLPLDEALEIARQLADALEAAHEHGIVHRDLKPGNIKLRADGTVKVLDFGLAKVALDHEASGINPTITSPAMTMQGVILGTAAYMSPEQAKGRAADKRSDIWAFGCVLYEMLTGKLLFAGETVSETIADVLRKKVDFDQLPPSTPPNVRRLIERCLVRDPRNRLRDIGDARIELTSPLPVEDRRPPARPSVLVWALGVVAVASLALAAFLAFGPNRQTTASPSQTIHFTASQPGLTVFSEIAISHDGSRIAFRGTDGGPVRLWTRTLSAPTAVPIPNTEGGRLPFWSPDGSELGFFNTRGLVAVNVESEVIRTITSDISAPPDVGAPTWITDGTVLIGGAPRPLVRVNAKTGVITRISDSPEIRYPSLLPNGTHFLYTMGKADAIVEAIAVAPLSDPSQGRVLIDVPSRVHYANGHLLYVRDGTLMAHPFDLSRLALSGDPYALTDGVGYFRPSGRASFWAAADTIVYIASAPDVDVSVMDRTGTVVATFGQPGQYQEVAISPDGTRAIISLVNPRTGVGDLHMYDLNRRISTRVTNDDASEAATQWSRDGRTIVYGSDRNGGPPDVYMQELDSGANARRILAAPGIQYPHGWLPDGRLLISDSDQPNRNMMALTIGDPPIRQIVQPAFRAGGPGSAAVSPNGLWIAFSTTETPGARAEIFVQPLGRPGPRVRVSRNGGVGPRWSRDGSELFFRIIRDVMVSDVSKGESLSFSPPRVLFSLDRPIAALDVTPDGQRFLVVPAAPPAFAPMHVLVNWRRQ